MAAPIPLRDDHDGPTLRRLAKASNDANQTRRLLALASSCPAATPGQCNGIWTRSQPR